MLNTINRFVRNIESEYFCDEDCLTIETALFIPERITAKTSIPWISIFSHISNFIEEQGIVRSLSITDISLDYLPEIKEISTNLNYKINNNSMTPVTAMTSGLSDVLANALILSTFSLEHDEDNYKLSANIKYQVGNNPDILTLSSNVINLSVYKSSEEEDPIFWMAERNPKIIIPADNLNQTPLINQLDLTKYHEQIYTKGNAISGTYTLAIPAADASKTGSFTLYLEEDPNNDPSQSFTYVLSETNIDSLPTRRPWLSSSNGSGIWKFEFNSLFGETSWHCNSFTKYAKPESRSTTIFTLSDGTTETYDISGTLDQNWMINNGYYDSGWIKTIINVDIGNNVTNIENNLFEQCTDLISVTIGNGVMNIGDYVFYWCTGLTSVTIGNSVTSIGENAFYGCTNLTSVTIPSSVTSIGNAAFDYCTNLTSVTIPGNVTSLGNYAFSRCTNLTSVTIPGNVTSLGNYAFYGCSGLTSVTIGDGVTNIGENTFKNCSGLVSMTIPDSVISIGDEAFSGCSSLTNITIPDGVTSIREYTFSGCRSLTSMAIPNSVTSIESSAFKRCTGLTSMTIPDGVTSIGDNAFEDCSGLTSVIIPDSVTSIGDEVFSDCTGLMSMTIPDSVTDIGSNAFYGCSGLTSVTIGDGVTNIGQHAFYGCSGLTSVTIPDSVADIGNWAFYNTNLTNVIMSEKDKSTVQGMTNYSWGLPSGCVITCAGDEEIII